ncbi:hypothetical protein JZX86_27945 [Agrobacterium rosae]|uniref:Uncharacterized protein n=1 Tax=Agrobacterium rosae TaxID=1972867 RepID=A0AAW9FJK0_9HYPH|nr:hypothetical protein [Agrobacterium rosae]MBN7809157.1 hypothetical protein [Agrobacterium rosae]MDX8304707.1 hypothetical protein [Agrobacterium rosae]
MNQLNRGMLVSALIWLSLSAPGLADDKSLNEFMIDQGCALGPSTMSAAIAAKIDPSTITKLIADALADSKTAKTGEWLVLSKDKCEIRPPRIHSEIAIDDPEVVHSTSVVDAFIKDGFPGCFLDASSLRHKLRMSRGWSADKATQEYLRFFSSGLITGDLAFFSPDPLQTPPGVMVLRGACASAGQIENVRKSHELLIGNFDALIRADAAGEATCESSGVPSWKFPEVSQRILGRKAPNAWMGYEITFIAMGAGWYEGQSATQKGRPRPPLCRYATD